jgi:hypothetical protein
MKQMKVTDLEPHAQAEVLRLKRIINENVDRDRVAIVFGHGHFDSAIKRYRLNLQSDDVRALNAAAGTLEELLDHSRLTAAVIYDVHRSSEALSLSKNHTAAVAACSDLKNLTTKALAGAPE